MQKFIHNGRVYHFAWQSSYMGEVDYMIADETGTFRAEWRHKLGDYERSILNYSPAEIVTEIENKIGLLTRCVCYNRGEILPETVAAFNAWRAANFAEQIAFMQANPDRYGDVSDMTAPPAVAGGYWERGKGWTAVQSLAIAA